MTIQFTEGTIGYSLYLNVANVSSGVTRTLQIVSQYSNTDIIDTTFTIAVTNDRYTRIDFEIPLDLPTKHLNQIANYIVTIDSQLVDQGVLKLTTEPGGGQFTQDYISNNENRQAKVYYRPEY